MQTVQPYGQQAKSLSPFLLTFIGETKVLVSINGPIEVPRRDELVSETTIDIQFRPLSGFPGSLPFIVSVLRMLGPHEKTLELKLRQFISSLILRTLNPRSLVQIVIQIVSIDTTSTDPVKHLSPIIHTDMLCRQVQFLPPH